MEVNSPQQLLEKIQSQIGQNVLKKVPFENEDYHLQVKQKADDMGVKYEASEIGVDNLIQGYWDDIEMLDAKEVKIIKEKIAIGNAKIDSVRARLVKDGNFYVIIFDFGLYIYLNKNLKLLYASQQPEDVIYCNRLEKDQFSKSIFREYRDELCQIYKGARRVMGAMILLKPEVTLVGFQLYFIELFILCHELGHFFNGDLEDKNQTIPLSDNSDSQVLRDEYSQKKEFDADIKGFHLVLRILIKKNESGKSFIHPQLILNTLIINFNILAELAPKESSTHPYPLNRLLHIIDVYYGQDAADFILKTYEEPDFMNKNAKKFMEISNRLNKLFDKNTPVNNTLQK